MYRRNRDIYRRGRRIQPGKAGQGPVVYWMSRDQRVHDNWSLLWAQQEALIHGRSLLVLFCLTRDFPGTTPTQVDFIIQGLQPIAKELQQLSIGWAFIEGIPDKVLPEVLHRIQAHSLVCDFNPLTIYKKWKTQLTSVLSIPFSEVDSHNIIPAWTVSNKKEYAAYTIRPKIKRLLGDFLTDFPAVTPHPFPCPPSCYPELQLWKTPPLTTGMSPPPCNILPGPEAALTAAHQFCATQLCQYYLKRNNPCEGGQSGLSPYLHFGHLSAQKLARMVVATKASEEITEPFLEELIVRRELSDNFCLYEEQYNNLEGFSAWAQKTLAKHRKDTRDFNYSLEVLEAGQTHETLWNCCQLDLVYSGKLHGFLRMYWAKKILEWTIDPETALEYATLLNDKYSIDGHDPNGYTGIAWSIGGVHDRAWGQRPVFGKIRYMNEAGCRRKFDVDTYIARVLKTTGQQR